MKKVIVGILTGVVVVGGASFVAAESNGNGILNFEEMKPYIEEMHPDWTAEDQEAMFNACHGEGGAMQNSNSFGGMMNNF